MKIRDCMKRNVIFIPETARLSEAVSIFAENHIGLLPIIDETGHPVGVLGLRDLVSLALPAFVNLIRDVDFVHDFGAVESAVPKPETLAQSVVTLMRPATTIREDSGLLRAYALMYQRDLHDLPVVSSDGKLVGIVSRVDIGTTILASWQAH